MTASPNDRRSLEHVRLFASLPPETLARLDKRCRWRRYAAGSEVIAFRDSARDVYFLTEGLARVIIHTARGRDVAFRTVGPGDIFGEYSAIDGEARSASVLVVETSTIGSMSAWDFRNALADEPDLSMALLTSLTAEIRGLTGRVLEFSTLAVANRIQAELLRLAGAAAGTGGEAVIRPAPKHAVVASRVSTHREAVTKELGRLQRLGLIERRNNDLVIIDLARLARMVQEAMDE